METRQSEQTGVQPTASVWQQSEEQFLEIFFGPDQIERTNFNFQKRNSLKFDIGVRETENPIKQNHAKVTEYESTSPRYH